MYLATHVLAFSLLFEGHVRGDIDCGGSHSNLEEETDLRLGATYLARSPWKTESPAFCCRGFRRG